MNICLAPGRVGSNTNFLFFFKLCILTGPPDQKSFIQIYLSTFLSICLLSIYQKSNDISLVRQEVLYQVKKNNQRFTQSAWIRKFSMWQRLNSFVIVSNFKVEINTRLIVFQPKRIEYILEGKLLEKSVKRPFCCTVSILQVYFTYLCYITFWALEYHFMENLKLI